MTREQARREIDSLDYYLQNHTNDYSEESHTAMMMAKDALGSSENPNTCGDAISRQAAISAIMGEYPDAHYPSYYKSKIEELPSVTPQQRTGRWIKDEHENGVPYIWVCSNCGTYHRAMYNYCPSCGAKMEVQE